MKRIAACCVILLVCLTPSATPVTAAIGATGVTGSVPLVTYEASASDIGRFTATVSWKTNAAATSQVFYDTRPHEDIADYARHTAEDTDLVTEHSVTLTRLRPRATYHFRVRSAIPGTGLVAISDDYSFSTLSPPVVVVPPVPPAPPPVPPGPPPGIPRVLEPVTAGGVFIKEAIAEFLKAGLTASFVANDRQAIPEISALIPRFITWPFTGAITAAVIVAGIVSQAPGPRK